METKFPKDISDNMKDCILSIFWPKKEIISFFKNNGCTDSDIKSIVDNKELSRSQIVDSVFEKLYNRTDSGLGQFRSMLQSLINWDRFDPYYFVELKKLDVDKAKKNIQHLKELQEIRDGKIKAQSQNPLNSQFKSNPNTNLATLKKRFLNLYQGKNDEGKIINSQQRGYLFESFLQDLLVLEKLSTTEKFQFNIPGEQIDGALKYDGENYIIEAKWQDKMTSSNALYNFAHKIDGKMYGRGVFISINGFSSDSVQALTTGKSLKTILFDGEDLTLIVEGMWTFTKMLDQKIKAAQNKGYIYSNPQNLESKI